MSVSSGTRLGPYEIVAPLGEGGMGQVYRARGAALNRDVAIKVLPEAFAADPDRLRRFTGEAQTLVALAHPNIAAIYGTENFDGGRALVMEPVEGDDLSRAWKPRTSPASSIAISNPPTTRCGWHAARHGGENPYADVVIDDCRFP